MPQGRKLLRDKLDKELRKRLGKVLLRLECRDVDVEDDEKRLESFQMCMENRDN